MICKYKYDSDKYKTVLDAIKTYLSVYTGIKEKYITLGDIYHTLLNAAKSFFGLKDWVELFENDIPRTLRNKTLELFQYDLNIEYFCYLIIEHLLSMKVKNSDDSWIIDLSDYDDSNIV